MPGVPNRSASTSTWIVIDVLPTLERFCVKADQIADKDRFVKDDLFHRDGHKPVVLRMPDRLDAAGDVDIAQNNAAKNGAVGVSVTRHHRQSYRRISDCFVCSI